MFCTRYFTKENSFFFSNLSSLKLISNCKSKFSFFAVAMELALINKYPKYHWKSVRTTADWYTTQRKKTGFDLQTEFDCYINVWQTWPRALTQNIKTSYLLLPTLLPEWRVNVPHTTFFRTPMGKAPFSNFYSIVLTSNGY